MRLTKRNLLSLIRENLDEMAMDFDSPDRPHSELQSKLQRNDTNFKKVPFPKTGNEPNKNFQELLASERYKQVVEKLSRYLGVRKPTLSGANQVGTLVGMMSSALQNISSIERAHKKQLEDLAVELVKKEMAIPEGSLQFDVKIVGIGDVDADGVNNNPQNQDAVMADEIDLADAVGKLDLEKAKRSLINAMIQGASKRGHYMFHMVEDKLREITGSADLINHYGVMMSINDGLYWQLPESTMQQHSTGGPYAGKTWQNRNTQPPTVYARGINFPVLVHEIIKGVMEIFAIQGRPEGDEGWEEVESAEDDIQKEVWQLRLGPAIWDRIRGAFPEDILIDENKRELQNYLLVSIFRLPAREFLVFMREVLGKTTRGERLMKELMDGIYNMMNDQDYQEDIDAFQDEVQDASDETDDDDLDDFLSGFGITLSK
jgi:hypothetical protein